ncbi:hypothetical protein LTR62_008263 [Meristemomyces frigidus]|uniref:Aminotransferase class I/classII large domain-containing protein n=1 Tax=Meristemomyces frigidus TaxID=1508187 RepID=A0AAN7YCZ4_9PEZI|nr:hypothetical protein LTR62_008263 [Meristemomyces frigidus]
MMLTSGNVDEDAWAIRYFAEQAFPVIFVAHFYAKNMGLYGERVGCIHVVPYDANQAQRIPSQLKRLQRVEITPPSFGARVAAIILNDALLYQQWLQDLRMLFDRISDMRFRLRQQLESKQGTGTWKHLTDQKGKFCFSGLNHQQVKTLRERFIYTPRQMGALVPLAQ